MVFKDDSPTFAVDELPKSLLHGSERLELRFCLKSGFHLLFPFGIARKELNGAASIKRVMIKSVAVCDAHVLNPSGYLRFKWGCGRTKAAMLSRDERVRDKFSEFANAIAFMGIGPDFVGFA